MKFYDEEYESQLKDIEWSLGRTGVLTPVAIYDDVEIDGTVCNRASLHNVSVLRDIMHTPYIGQKVKIAKMNMIIPQITWADDDWTVVTADSKPSAHFEHTVAVTKEGYTILTKR